MTSSDNASTSVVQIVCGHCDTVNGIPKEALGRAAGVAQCGQCGKLLFAGKPVDLKAANIRTHMAKNGIPVLIDFWASWCGSCNHFTPTFTAAAQQFEPYLRCAKFNAEGHMDLIKELNIQQIPTLALYLGGKEIARSNGSMPLPQLEQWVVSQLQPVLSP